MAMAVVGSAVIGLVAGQMATGSVGSWQADSLEVQRRRVGDAIATVEQLRRALVSTSAEMQWRSRTAGRFARRVEVQVASMDGLIFALRELEGALLRARSRMLHVEHVPG